MCDLRDAYKRECEALDSLRVRGCKYKYTGTYAKILQRVKHAPRFFTCMQLIIVEHNDHVMRWCVTVTVDPASRRPSWSRLLDGRGGVALCARRLEREGFVASAVVALKQRGRSVDGLCVPRPRR